MMASFVFLVCEVSLVFASLFRITGQIDNQSTRRERSHIDGSLKLDQWSFQQEAKEREMEEILEKLKTKYHEAIKPMEDLYRFRNMNKPPITDADIKMKPAVLFVGPWSTGKSSMINYLLDIEDKDFKLLTGAQPTSTEFTVLMHGDKDKTIEGMVLAADSTKPFFSLEKFGLGFLQRLQGLEVKSRLLEKVILIDTPGILENKKQQSRGYPFIDVLQWFIDHADLIFVVFDPTKLDVGSELEVLFKQMKGHEAKIKLILNKADTIPTQELMRVYGALFWNLAPLINSTEPPRVYTGSFWGQVYKKDTSKELFHMEEMSLLHDMNDLIESKTENKIAHIRQRAILVRQHALIVDQFLKTFNRKVTFFSNSEATAEDIIDNPDKYKIYKIVAASNNVSMYDLPAHELYQEFFSLNAINSFAPLSSHCTYFAGCILDNLNKAINEDLPNLIALVHELDTKYCSSEDETCGASKANPET